MSKTAAPRVHRSRLRFAGMILIGLVAAGSCLALGAWAYSLAVGWAAAALLQAG